MKDQSNKNLRPKPTTNVEFGSEIIDINSAKVAETIISNQSNKKEKKNDKQKKK